MPVDRRKNSFSIVPAIATRFRHFIIFCLCFLLSNSPAEPSSFLCPTQCTCSSAVKTVNCSNRSLRKLPSQIPQEVVVLSFRNNKIPDTELHKGVFKHLTHLQSLDLSDNRLKKVNLTFSSDLPLNTLYLDKCKLDSIPVVKGARNLTTLSLSRNSIGSINVRLNNWPHLQSLDLSFNNKIRTLQNHTFHHLRSLTTLNLCKNQISTIEVKAFHGLTSLENLILCRNKIRDLKNFTHMLHKDKTCKSFPHLRYLDLSRNRISKIDGLVFKGLCKLETLLLSHNRIHLLGHGAFYNLKFLTTLYLDHNQLLSVDNYWLYDMNSLRNMSLSHNNISVIDELAWKFCPEVRSINLSHNQLRRLQDETFQRLSHLNHLDLSHNIITVINKQAFAKLTKLLSLNLSRNHISSTMEDLRGIFTNLSSLTSLDLNTNQIRALNPAIFEGLNRVTSVNLSINNVTSVDNLTFNKMTKLKELIIDSSSLLCDCKLVAFADWLSLQPDLIQFITASCFHPPGLKGKKLVKLQADQLVCGEHPVPSLLQQPDDRTVHKTDNVTLECSASATLSKGEVGLHNVNMTATWKRGRGLSKKEIQENEMIRIRSMQRVEGSHVFFTSFLLLYDVHYHDDDEYSCLIKNGFGEAASTAAHLTVVSLPRIIIKPMNKTVKVDSEVIIDCQATGHPLPQISWEKEGGSFAAADQRRLVMSDRRGESIPGIDDDDITKIVPLHIKPVKSTDAGKYKCSAKSDVGMQSSLVSVTVLYPPSIEGMPALMEVVPRENPVLKCMVHAYPPADVQWSFNNSSLRQTARHFLAANKQLLVIIGMKDRDQGYYRCSVNNSLGKRQKVTQLVLSTGRDNTEDDLWDSLWGTPGVILVVSICVLASSFVWLLFCCCSRARSDESQPDKTDPYYDVVEQRILSTPQVIHDHVARPLHCSRSIPTSPSGENRSQSFPLASRSLPRNSRHDALPSLSTCFSTLPDRVHHSAVAANSVNYPDVTHCKSRRPPNRRRVKCQRIASTDSCAPSSDEETSSDGDVTSSSSSVAQETPLVAQSLQNNDPP